MMYDLREGRMDRKRARNVLRYMGAPYTVHYLAADQINRPGRKRAARWARRWKIKMAQA